MAARIPMTPIKVFWDIIGASKRPSCEEQREALIQILVNWTTEELIGFDNRMGYYYHVPNRLELWVAMDLLFGSTHDEGRYAADDQFLDFLSWLVARGWPVFEKATTDPNSLADLPVGERARLIPFFSIANDAWVEKTGHPWESFPNLDLPSERDAWAREVPSDWDVEDDEELKSRFPRLTALRSEQQP